MHPWPTGAPWLAATPMVDLAFGQLRVPAGEEWVPAMSEPQPLSPEGRLYLPWAPSLDSLESAIEWLEAVVVALRGTGCALTLQMPADRLAASVLDRTFATDLSAVSTVVVLDPTCGLDTMGAKTRRAEIALRCASRGLGKPVLAAPLIGGLVSRQTLASWLAWASLNEVTSIVPIQVTPDPKASRRLLDWARAVGEPLDPSVEMALFQSDPLEVRDAASMIAASEMRWWIDPEPNGAGGRGVRNGLVAAQLLLLADVAGWLGEPLGFVEGHRQAARRVGGFEHDAWSLVQGGNLRLLDWLDQRAVATLEEWVAAASGESAEPSSEPPALGRFRSRFVADSKASAK